MEILKILSISLMISVIWEFVTSLTACESFKAKLLEILNHAKIL